ncbi:hypothetical protein IDH44_18245 [Paenibacillus sp. IB182496]|uniref:Uncharacterized protein n=1 Tax=Paenibacillus sabuli TaxID=2772509 RepID=A0A927BX67_9BACL|nr:hypothetical protein [Paenibacillus sabuli]
MSEKQQRSGGSRGQSQPGSEGRVEGRDVYDMEIDRMVNEGLGGGQVTVHNGLIEETTTDTMPGTRDEASASPQAGTPEQLARNAQEQARRPKGQGAEAE